MLNRPYDHHLTRLVEWLPYRLRMFLFLRLLVFEYKRMGITLHQLQARGLPLPTFDIWNARLTPCNDLLQRIMSGAIQVKPRMTRLEGQQVYFANGSAGEADVVISCTGYTLRPGGSSGHLQRSTTGLMSLERSSRITLIEVKDCKSLSSRRGSGSKILS